MSNTFKSVIMVLMTTALAFGFINRYVPLDTYNFERLHVFLFNLCSGGTLILFFTQRNSRPSCRVVLFFTLSLCYALFAFLNLYIPVLFISAILAVIVESIRISRFSFFPSDFFKANVPVSQKFHQASLLCLSMGLVISSLVIVNNVYMHWITNMPKLALDTFFLGFSFPLSLITLSLIFSFMTDHPSNLVVWKNLAFWAVNLGVIIFFLFIIFEMPMAQVAVTMILFSAVLLVLFLAVKLVSRLQQKNFLISGIAFLVITAITGIMYIVFEMMPGYNHENLKWLLTLHAFASLYGWNLCGLSIVCRYNDFPIRLHSKYVIIFHWVIVIILAPLGYWLPAAAVAAVISYCILLYVILFTQGNAPVRGK
ncbi:MAG: hypothetical protein GXP53_04565 [Deltaproteobacteria bacterium]|nr:hypothetical protein [Deltaproteobacteria bacterium]